MTTIAMEKEMLNGVDVSRIRQLAEDVKADKAAGMTKWNATTRWVNGVVMETEVAGCDIGGQRIDRTFKFCTDEPKELAGTNRFANPQEYLLGALNSCMMVGYVALCSLQGIELESVEIESAGELDLRGFLGLDPAVKPGCEEIRYKVRIKGNGTAAQFREIHETVIKTSPNRFTVSQPVRLVGELVVA